VITSPSFTNHVSSGVEVPKSLYFKSFFKSFKKRTLLRIVSKPRADIWGFEWFDG
jgi:hypothetical protein